MIEPNYVYRATVVNVVDGDTLDADLDVGFHMTARLRLRLARVNCEEMHDPVNKELAVKAKYLVRSLVLNESVMIQTAKWDAFGRYLAEIWFSGAQINLSDELLRLKLARPFTR